MAANPRKIGLTVNPASKTPNLSTPYTRADGVECHAHEVGDCLLSADRRKSNLTLMEAYQAGIIARSIEVYSGMPQGLRSGDTRTGSNLEKYGDYAERSDYILRKKHGWQRDR